MNDLEKVPTIDLNKGETDKYGPIFEQGRKWGRYPKSSNWLECNAECDGEYNIDPVDKQLTCNKCGHKVKTVWVDDNTIKFGGMTSFDGRRSFYLHVRPGDRIHIYKEYRDNQKPENSPKSEYEQKVVKMFNTFKFGDRDIDFIQVNFYVDVTMSLRDLNGAPSPIESYSGPRWPTRT